MELGLFLSSFIFGYLSLYFLVAFLKNLISGGLDLLYNCEHYNMIEVIFILYLLLIICVGILSNKFVSSQLDFLLAGRRLGPWVTAFSERASGESAWLLLGLPGAAIAIGYGEIWAVIGITIGIISSWFLIAERLRDETEKFDSLTFQISLRKNSMIRLV